MAEALYEDYPGLIGDTVQADTIKKTFTFSQDGSAIDVTGYKMYLFVSSSRDGSGGAEYEFDPSDAVNGKFIVGMTDSQTLALTPGVYFYSIKYVTASPGFEAQTVDMGKFTIRQAINPRVDQT